MGPRSIVHVISGLETGGAEVMLLRLLRGTDRHRWRPAVISLRDRGTIGDTIEELEVPLVTLGIRGPLSAVMRFGKLAGALHEMAPQAILGWMYHGNLAALLGRWRVGGGAPLVWNIRYVPDRLSREKGATAVAIRAGAVLSARASRIVYNSRAGADRHAQLGYAAQQACVIPNGFDTDQLAPSRVAHETWRSRLGLDPAAVLIGRIGRYHAMKDHHTFLRAASLLGRQRSEVHFVMAGKGVDAANLVLASAVTELGLGGRVSLLGEVHPINQLTAALDIACSSSAYGEAFPNVLGEAMACGVPCVTTDVGDSAWIVGSNDWVVPPRNPEALASAFRRLVDAGATERLRLGTQARSRVVQEFSLSRALASYESVYAELLG